MRFLFVLCLWICVNAISAQTSGEVIYNSTVYFDTEGMPPQFAADMPTSMSTQMHLLYTKTESIYKKDPNAPVIEEAPARGGRFMRMRRGANSIYYKDLANQSVLEQQEFFGKMFLVSDSIANLPWKISAGEQKTILGKMCMKATYSDSTSKYVVFFTPQIPVSSGPDKFGKLPGLILEYQSARQHIIATEIKEFTGDITEPDKGDKVTRKEFTKIRDEKMKEQAEMWGGRNGGGGNIRIMRSGGQ
jgi:GLPGLI family protein